MSFHFHMQKVLEYREQLEEEARCRLAKAETNLLNAQGKLENLRKQLLEAENKSLSGPLMQSAERWLHDQYLKGLRGDVREADMQTRMLKQVADEARNNLAARAIDKKILENLKDRQRKQFFQAELKQEQYFNDEIATIRHKAPAI